MNCEIFVDPYDGHFTFDYQRFNSGGPGLEIPRWQGTPADNKLVSLTPPPRRGTRRAETVIILEDSWLCPRTGRI